MDPTERRILISDELYEGLAFHGLDNPSEVVALLADLVRADDHSLTFVEDEG